MQWTAVVFCAMLCAAASGARAQTPAGVNVTIELPVAPRVTEARAQGFSFASDGPKGAGWTRPDEIARVYFDDPLPALFERTLALDGSVPQGGTLAWVFTGPHAGFTVELSAGKVRLFQRYYDSMGLYSGKGSYPEKVTADEARAFTGGVRTLAVVVDEHLAIAVLLNGKEILREPCTFDVTRHQLMFSGPRDRHLTVAGALLQEQTQNATITVDSAKTHQTMIGFGGSPSIPAYARMDAAAKDKYWAILRHYNLLLDREYPMGTELKRDLSNLDDLRDATPHYYGDNFPNGEVSSFEYSRRAVALGGDVIYEMWALPKWATVPYKSPGKPIIDAWKNEVTSAANPEEYARIVVGYCRMAKERTGRAPAIVGIENEVEQPPEVYAQMAVTLRRELDKAGFQSVKIHMADAPYVWQGAERAEAQKKDAKAWAAIDYTAAHEYDFQKVIADPDKYDAVLRHLREVSGEKPFIATEICVNDPHYQEPSYRIAFNIGQLYQKNLTEIDAEALMYCWLLLDVEQPTFGGSRALLVPDRSRGNEPVASSFQLRVLGAFSRHVLKGMRRVDAVSSNPDLLSVGFEGDGKATLIVMNRSTEAQRLDVKWAGETWSEMERTSQYAENVDAAVPNELVVQPGEIVTLATFAAK